MKRMLKVVVFDSSIPVQLAFYALVEHGELNCVNVLATELHSLAGKRSHLFTWYMRIFGVACVQRRVRPQVIPIYKLLLVEAGALA